MLFYPEAFDHSSNKYPLQLLWWFLSNMCLNYSKLNKQFTYKTLTKKYRLYIKTTFSSCAMTIYNNGTLVIFYFPIKNEMCYSPGKSNFEKWKWLLNSPFPIEIWMEKESSWLKYAMNPKFPFSWVGKPLNV